MLLDVLEMQQVTVITLGDAEAEQTIANAIDMLKLATSEELLVFEGAVETIAELQVQQEALNLQLGDLDGHFQNMSNLIQQSPQFTPLLSLEDQYLGMTDAGYGAICSNNPFGDPPNGPNRANPDAVQAAGIANFTAETVREVAETVRDVAGRACDQVVVGIGVGGNTSLACIAADVLYAIAKGVELAVRIAYYLLTFCDATIDGAEIEGAYERASDIYDQNTDLDADLAAHDANIIANLAAHDANIDADLTAHDANIDADLVAHDANIDADLVAHDANIDADLAAHDANIDADLAAHDANIDADLVAHDTKIEGLLGGVQETLDEKVELRRVFMQVLLIEQRKRYLVLTKEAGVAVDVTLLSIEVFDEDTDSFEIVSSATFVPLETGLYDMELNLTAKSPDKVFRIRVRHDVDDAPGFEHFGEIMFHRTGTESSN